MKLDRLPLLLPAEPNGPPPKDFEGYVVAKMHPFGEGDQTDLELTQIAFVWHRADGEHFAGGVPVEEIERWAPLPDVPELLAEVERLRGLKPETGPEPFAGLGLPRYGLRWNGPTEPLVVPMDDGYWTPWHIANVAIERDLVKGLRAEIKAQMDTACSIDDKLKEARESIERMRVVSEGLRADLATQTELAGKYLGAGIEALGLFHPLYRAMRSTNLQIHLNKQKTAKIVKGISDALGTVPASRKTEDATVPVLRCARCEEEFVGEEGKTYEHGVICPAEKGRGIVGVCHVVRHITPSEAARLRAPGKEPG